MELKYIIKSIHELIQSESFRKRTAMYIGEPTISNLESFILGYYFGESIHKFDLTLMGTHFTTFNDWVMKYYTWRESTAGWKNIILKEVGNNETEALQMFFILYDKFTAENLEAV